MEPDVLSVVDLERAVSQNHRSINVVFVRFVYGVIRRVPSEINLG